MKWPKNLAWKLSSLLLAILLWAAVSIAPDVVTTHTVPILYQNLGTNFLVAGDPPEKIQIEIRGAAPQLTPANLIDTVVLLDLADVKTPGERTLTISDANLTLPSRVTFLRAVPSQLRLRFDRLARQSVPVVIKYSDGPPVGYRIASQSVTPPTLRVVGSETRVAAIHVVETDPIDLSGVTGSREFRVNAFINDARVRFESSAEVNVKVVVERIGDTR
jgi:YbbR-like protein